MMKIASLEVVKVNVVGLPVSRWSTLLQFRDADGLALNIASPSFTLIFFSMEEIMEKQI